MKFTCGSIRFVMFSHLGVDHSNPCGTNSAEWCQGARSRTSRPCSRWYHHARAQSSLLFLVRLRKNFLCFCNCPVCNSVELFGLYCFLSQFKVSYVDYFKSVHIAFTLTMFNIRCIWQILHCKHGIPHVPSVRNLHVFTLA